MTSKAIGTQGFKFEIGNGDSPLTYTEVKEVVNFSGLDGTSTKIDVTNLQSQAKEFILGLQDFGTWKMDVNHIFTDAGQNLLRTAKGTRVVQDFKATFSDTSTVKFQGLVSSNPISGGVDAKVDGTFSIEVTGLPVITPAV